MSVVKSNPIIIWRLLDGKPGHENQSLGLVNSIKRKVSCESYDISVKGKLEPLINYVSAMWPFGRELPYPDLIVGAGHGTHMHMLAAKKAYGGSSIVLMQPSFPVSWFDLCLIPEHDAYQGRGRHIETRGVLNALNSDGEHHTDKALIMIGGHSRHYEWETDNLIAQIYQLLDHNPTINFTLTTSRRTPIEFLTNFSNQKFDNLEIVPFDKTPPDWIKQQLAESSIAWITEDSVSMIYESLTARVAVGILNVPINHESRVTRGIEKLIHNKYVVRFDNDAQYKNDLHPIAGFMEADRCADQILKALINNPSVISQPTFAKI
ncbi:MAG TPA: ELM1/GtrOC1 family putative glycosyltransferase [Methylotenera sp.]|nr:ELM1/GtrOC1 family putative glycosyltransferase [Methylotenera sp.]